MTARTPRIGDEVEYAPGARAIVTDMHHGTTWLRAAGCYEWQVEDPSTLTVTQTREQRIAAHTLPSVVTR